MPHLDEKPVLKDLCVAARESPLSRAQVEEVRRELEERWGPLDWRVIYVETTGDSDRETSLRDLERSDFFTRELDEMLIRGQCDLCIHSAKDLPEPLPGGIDLLALTRGVDPRDALVLRRGETLEGLPPGARIATSSARREAAVTALRPDLSFIDLRGQIHERLRKLHTREADGVVVALAALIRLGLTEMNWIPLPGEVALNQGRLAIVGRSGSHDLATALKLSHSY